MCNQHDRQAPDRRLFLAASVAATAGVLVAAGTLTATATRARAADPSQADQIIQDWPETAKKAAQEMIEKYGTPDEAVKRHPDLRVMATPSFTRCGATERPRGAR
jgi:hypothetical protein